MNTPEPVETILSGLNRPMPYAKEAEQGVLSCILQNPMLLQSHFNAMPPALFYHPAHREIFTTLVDELVCGRPLDPPSITHRLRSAGRLEQVGGPAFIAELFAYVPLPSHFQFYLTILREVYVQRRNIEAHARSLDLLFSAESQAMAKTLDDVKGLLEEAGKMPGQLLKSYNMAESMDALLAEIEDRRKHPGKLPGISTGFPTIDKNTGGMMPGQVWVFAGEPGDGKSTIMQNLAENAAATGSKVRWYPLEMPHNEQMLRLMASASTVDNGSLYSGVLTNRELDSIRSATIRLKTRQIELVDVEEASATDIFADIERSDAAVVVVDYLQLLDDTGIRKSDTRETVLASISRRQKRLARRTGKTILTASQLNDQGRLRESRAIGQDADKVFTVEKWTDEKGQNADDARRRMRNDKNRGGKRGWKMDMRFIGSIFQFREEVES